MSEETRQRIIRAGADLVHRKGFNNTGLKDILRAADVPKGSFYFYFDNKEAFGIAMVDHYGTIFRGMFENITQDETKPPLEQLREVLDVFHQYFKNEGYTRGCPVGNLAQEMSDLSEPFRARLLQAMDGLAGLFEEILRRAQTAGDIPADLDVRETSIFIVEACHGAFIRMKVTKSGEPLEICNKFILEKLLK